MERKLIQLRIRFPVFSTEIFAIALIITGLIISNAVTRYMENNTWARGDMEFSSSVQFDISRVRAANERDIELNTRRENPHLQATMYYFVYYINISLTRRSRLSSRFKTRPYGHSFIALNEASDMSAADWLSHTNTKNYDNFSRVVIGFFSVVEILIKH